MKADLADLRKELRFALGGALLSKEVIVTTLAAAATVASWTLSDPLQLQGVVEIGGSAATIGGVAATSNKYFQARHEILRKHPMAYLYSLS
jgi:hypothetical protein